MKIQKKQFRIGELAKHLCVKRFVIRFWEKEFNLNAHRSGGGQRFYGCKDLEKFQCIKKLLYEEGYTIAGAKKRLEELLGSPDRMIASKRTAIDEQDEPTTKEFVKKLDFYDHNLYNCVNFCKDLIVFHRIYST